MDSIRIALSEAHVALQQQQAETPSSSSFPTSTVEQQNHFILLPSSSSTSSSILTLLSHLLHALQALHAEHEALKYDHAVTRKKLEEACLGTQPFDRLTEDIAALAESLSGLSEVVQSNQASVERALQSIKKEQQEKQQQHHDDDDDDDDVFIATSTDKDA
eukprot:PhM_4_TR5635/c0_g1_i1/m.7783